MGLTLDPQKVFGDAATRNLQATIRTLNLTLAEAEKCNGNLLSQIKFAYGLDVTGMDRECQRVGATFIIIYDSGRIDRFQVVKRGIIRRLMKNENGAYRDYYLPENCRVGKGFFIKEATASDGRAKSLWWSLAKVKRIVWIYHL